MAYDGTDYGGIQWSAIQCESAVYGTVWISCTWSPRRKKRKKKLLNSAKKITFEWIKPIISSHLYSIFLSHHFKVLRRFVQFTLTLALDIFRYRIHYFALVQVTLCKFQIRIPLQNINDFWEKLTENYAFE